MIRPSYASGNVPNLDRTVAGARGISPLKWAGSLGRQPLQTIAGAARCVEQLILFDLRLSRPLHEIEPLQAADPRVQAAFGRVAQPAGVGAQQAGNCDVAHALPNLVQLDFSKHQPFLFAETIVLCLWICMLCPERVLAPLHLPVATAGRIGGRRVRFCVDRPQSWRYPAISPRPMAHISAHEAWHGTERATHRFSAPSCLGP